MNTDNLITPEGLAASLKMAAAGMKKNPKVMKSTVGYITFLEAGLRPPEGDGAPGCARIPTRAR